MNCAYCTGLNAAILPRCLVAPSGRKLDVWAGEGVGFRGTVKPAPERERSEIVPEAMEIKGPSCRSSSKCVAGMRDLRMSFGAMLFRMLLAASNKILNKK